MGLTAARQKRCDEIVEQALALDAGLRGAFVQDVSSDDEDVRREADAILNADPSGTVVFNVSPGAFLAPPKFGRYPGGRTDDLVMANWFFEWNLPRIYTPPRVHAPQARPSWLLESA